MNLGRISTLMLKNFFITRKNFDRICDIVFWPTVNLLLWGFTGIYLSQETGTKAFAGIFLSGLILWALFERVYQDISFYILEDFWSFSLKNIFATPLTSVEIITATIGFGLIRGVVTFLFMWLSAMVLHHFNILGSGFTGFFLLAMNLWLFACAVGIFSVSILFFWGTNVQFLTWSIAYLLQPFIGVFYPLSALPSWARPLSDLIPISHVFEGMRSLLATGTTPWEAVITSLLMNIPYLLGAVGIFALSIQRARKTGLITKY